jgi:predicted component of type VI protein secretion system
VAVLVLEVVSEHATSMGQAARRLVDFADVALFRIGRGGHNDWVSPAPTVSRDQAIIFGYHGLYMLQPTGRRAVALNDRNRPLARERLVRLAPGDRILIDELEILVSEPSDREAPEPLDATMPLPSISAPPSVLQDPGPLPLIDDSDATAVLPTAENGDLPAGWYNDRPDDRIHTRGELDMVWRAAGLEPARIKSAPKSARALGQLLRAVVSGLRDGLEARNAVRRGYRVPLTKLAATGNNPLKFSADADAALEQFLVARQEGFLGLAEAVEEAFRDLRNHQIAVLKGEEAVFESLLGKFDPERFERQLKSETGARVPVLARAARIKLWDRYCERYAELRSDEERTFRKFFSEPFAKTYEREFDRLHPPRSASDGGRAC